MNRFVRFLACLTAALALSVMTVTVLDGFNPMLRFLTSTPSKILLFVAGISSLVTACLLLWKRR